MSPRAHRALPALLCVLLGALPACTEVPIADQPDGQQPPPPDLGAPAADAADRAPDCPVGTSNDPLVVATQSGLLRGKEDGDTVAFLGVPYAAPPVGTLRFRPPAAACWSGVRDAGRYGAACPQKNFVSGKTEGDEDCLSLNVWTPRKRPVDAAARLPVLVFIHGGANVLGASNQQVILGNLYDGQDLSQRQTAVVVTLNYRLGALGFLAHPALTAESPRRSSGNYALLDQIAALRWVHDNIARFGGDPERVMLFGESAGGFATCALYASPLARGLFQRALIESGSCMAPPLASREEAGRAAAAQVGCQGAQETAACLRSASVDALVKTGGDIVTVPTEAIDFDHLWDLPYGAAVDGWVLPDSPIRMIKAGSHNRVPLALGHNANEMELFLPPGTPGSCAEFERLVRTAFPTQAAAVLRQYPCGLVPRHAAVDMMTDLFFGCPARRVARAAAQHAPVYRYLFSHVGLGTLSVLRSFHAAEVPFIFHSFAALAVIPGVGEEVLSRDMQGYWGRFAATADPNGAARPSWGRYDAARDNLIDLDVLIAAREGMNAERCNLWDSLVRE